ncbi:MAG TPA: bifunctional protein-serine/threonine kinase/phosphatase [Burkholderiales bacterium]
MLEVTLGQSSLTGQRPRNEDYCAAATPEGPELDAKGLVAAVADGVGGLANGREASERTVRGLLADYYATPDTWSVQQSLSTVLAALNRWLLAYTAHTRESAGMATTLSAVVLRGRRFYTAHVGDSRIYRLRDGNLFRLTADHLWEHPELHNVLSRAIGLDTQLAVDFGDGELEVGDVFALVTDGVWSHLGDESIRELLLAEENPEAAAGALAATAVKSGADDNCTALVMRVISLPKERLSDAIVRLRRLPLPPRLRAGEALDGLTVEEVLHESRVTLLYRVRDPEGRQLVLKTLRPEAGDEESAAALAHEEWLARRVTDAHFPQVVLHPQRTRLYYLMSWHEGATLKAHLAAGRRFSPAETADLGIRLLKGVAALRRLAIVHRDLKPDNLHLDAEGRLRILDLGVAASDGQALGEINNPGTPSYMAPELFEGHAADEATDLYAAGVTLYELLTRKYPYGEVEPFQTPRFGEPVNPARYRPDIPPWLEAVILKAVARERKERFETAEEFILALERGAHRPLAVPRRVPLAQRNPSLTAKVLLAGSLLLNLVLFYFVVRGR